MKRKFLAKAITLGLMLAVPLGAQAKEAVGVIINNVDGKSVSDVAGDVNLSLDIPVTNFDNVHSNEDYVIGIGNITGGQTIQVDSLNIKNASSTDFTKNQSGETEVAGIFQLQGSTVINNDLNIELHGQDTKENAKLGLFGIRTMDATTRDDSSATGYKAVSDGMKSTITVNGNTEIDVSGTARWLSGILSQDSDGINLNLGENTNIKITDLSGKDSINAWGIRLTKGNLYAGNINIEVNGGQQQEGFDGAGNYEINNLTINLNNARNKAQGFLAGGWTDTRPNPIVPNSSDYHVNGNVLVNIKSDSTNEGFAAEGIFLRSYAGNNEKFVFDKNVDVNIDAVTGSISGLEVGYENTSEISLNKLNINLKGGKTISAAKFAGNTKKLDVNSISVSVLGNENTKEVTGIKFNEKENNVGDLNLKIANVDNVDKDKIVGIQLSNNNYAKITGDVNIDVENGYAIKTGFWSNKQYLNQGLVLGKDKDDNDTTVKIKGDILGSEGGGGTIKLNLNNGDSYFTGTNTGKTEIILKDGATWTNTGASTVTSLDVNSANLVQGSADATITKFTENTTGSSSTKFSIAGDNTIALNTTSDGSTMQGSKNLFEDGTFSANDVADDTTIKLTSANQNASNISKENAADSFNNLVDALGDEQLKSKVTSAHLNGSYTANAIDAVAENGVFANEAITQDTGDTATVAAIKKLPSINLVSWRTENNELSKRLGEVRDYAGEEGIWARMNHGESKYLDSFKTKAHLYQMGYDKKVGEWRLGGAVSYNKGTTTYENGSGKNRSTSLALYGAWLGHKGHYADIIVKEGKQKSEMTIGQAGLAASNLDYDMWATSISAEYGRKITLENNWFVEPQAELTYGRLGSADYGDNGFTVHQDSMDSLVGRMGFRLGKNLSDTSNIYLKASLLHEFCGDVDYTFTEGSTSKVSNTDLGDTWYEVGVGGSAQIGKATYAYAGLEKTFGGDFSTPWQWNAGVRWSF